MKIAQIAPLMESVPPKAYGGTERVVSYLTEALVEMGHDVTLFASGDSRTAARLVPVVPRSLRLDPRHPDWLAWHTVMLDQVFEQAPEFDVVHFHVDFLHYPLVRRSPTPCLTTLHGRLDLPDLLPLHRHFREQALVSISQNQRKPLGDACRWLATVHHGLPLHLYRHHERPGDYLAFVGRISPEKRVDRAIRVATATGMTPVVTAAAKPVAPSGRTRPAAEPPPEEPEPYDEISDDDATDAQGQLTGAEAVAKLLGGTVVES